MVLGTRLFFIPRDNTRLFPSGEHGRHPAVATGAAAGERKFHIMLEPSALRSGLGARPLKRVIRKAV